MNVLREVSESQPEIDVIARGEVTPGEGERARKVIARILRRHDVDGGARIRLSRSGRVDAVTVAQINLDLCRTAIRTQIDGPAGFALTFAAERLDRQLHRLGTNPAPRWAPDPGRAPLAFVTAVRPIVRRKQCEPRVCDVATAVMAMDAMDYDAHLFTDVATGEDAVVYWAGPRGVRMARQRHTRPPLAIEELRLTMNPHPVHTLTESAAVLRLCGYGLPFLFYTDAGDRRGRLLYRRYAGDLGIVLANPDQQR